MKTNSRRRGAQFITLMLGTTLVATSATGVPAYWYRWQSLTTEKIICKQTDPGKGWHQLPGEYLDAACRLAKKPTTIKHAAK